VEFTVRLGYPESAVRLIGMILLVCLILYVVPATSVLGAVLLTGYLGGAVATQLRVGSPLLSTTLFPIYIGVLVWGGITLREERLRALFPLRR
jgi:ABC-type transport system involved in cytochrome c biogenesis permease component